MIDFYRKALDYSVHYPWNIIKYSFMIKSVFYKNELAKTVHTEIHIFGHIKIGGDLDSKIWCHKKFMI